MSRLAEILGPAFEGAGAKLARDVVRQSVRLCKADLTTQMVNEFPELEGIVGGLYARADGLPETIAAAIESHYLPRGADDPLPRTAEGAVVSLADPVCPEVSAVLGESARSVGATVSA